MNNKSFDDKRIAQGYAKDRPWLHPFVMERVKYDLHIDVPFHNGLDVGCGAGLSAKALKLICDKVTGTDISRISFTFRISRNRPEMNLSGHRKIYPQTLSSKTRRPIRCSMNLTWIPLSAS